jgi:cyclohexadienyl dehydratase
LPDVTSGAFDVGMGGISVTLDRQKVAFFSIPVMRTGKTPIARCTVQTRFQTLAAIDQPDVRVATNPGGTNEKYDRANLHHAQIVVFPSNAAIFDELLAGHADVMITDSVETRLQQKLHPELCAIHPDKPFDFGELAYLLPRDPVLKAYVDQFLHIQFETGTYDALLRKQFD